MQKFMGRKPDGEVTENAEEYGMAWKTLGERLEEKLGGIKIIGYDPGILIVQKDNAYGSPADIPLWLVKRIIGNEE